MMTIAPGAEKKNNEDGGESEDPGESDREKKAVGRERELCSVLSQPQHPAILRQNEMELYCCLIWATYSVVNALSRDLIKAKVPSISTEQFINCSRI